MNNPTKLIIVIAAFVIQLSLLSAQINFTCSIVGQTIGNANNTQFKAEITNVSGGSGNYKYCIQWEASNCPAPPSSEFKSYVPPTSSRNNVYHQQGVFDINGFVINSNPPYDTEKRPCGTVIVGAGIPSSITQNLINIIEMDAAPRKVKMDENILFTSTVKNLYEGEVEVDLNFYVSDEAGNRIDGPFLHLGPRKIAARQSYRFDWNYTVDAPLQAGKNYFINSKADANYTELPEYKRDNERRTIFSVVPEERTTKGFPETDFIPLILTIATITVILSLKHQHKKEKYIN